MMTTNDIAWLAGIIDGEGCFSIKNPVAREKRGRGCYQVWLVLCNTNRPMVERAADIIADLGCKRPSIRRVWKGDRATRYQFWLNIGAKRDLLTVTEALLPHLTAKRFEAQVVAWYLKRACSERHYRQTLGDVEALSSLSEVKRNGGEAPAEVVKRLREVIPSEAFQGTGAAGGGNERVETRRVSPNDNPSQECPASVPIH